MATSMLLVTLGLFAAIALPGTFSVTIEEKMRDDPDLSQVKPNARAQGQTQTAFLHNFQISSNNIQAFNV